MAAPTALATPRCFTCITSDTPGRSSGTRNAAPPTAISGTGVASTFIRSTASSIIALIRSRHASTSAGSSEAMASLSPSSTSPAATAMSVAVSVLPPNTRDSSVILWPTLSGPTDIPCGSTSDPPPRPIDSRSGIRKSVRTPPISTTLLASRGKPARSTPTSVVVPPTSITTASCNPVRNAAPRMLFVGPEAKL